MDGHNKLRSYFWGLQRLVANIVCHLIAVGFQTYGERIYNICPSEGREYKDTEFPSLQTEKGVIYLYHGLKSPWLLRNCLNFIFFIFYIAK